MGCDSKEIELGYRKGRRRGVYGEILGVFGAGTLPWGDFRRRFRAEPVTSSLRTRMSCYMKKLVFFVFLLSLNSLVEGTKSFLKQRTYDVYIANDLPGNTSPFEFHCQSKEDDLGNRQLLSGYYWDFTFHENIIRSTLFYCNFVWGSKQLTFNVFDDPIVCIKQAKGDQTDTCYWSVKSDGFYLANMVNPPQWALTKYYSW
uniref:S-protein homolog n=1 Tax=Nicotiana sylvestris TaxID=4096 RepID=A0A1U7WMK6_NICSY|nr:PREDICTED: uncharacterized protein LOC104225408 [Nicotiana sylvestris]